MNAVHIVLVLSSDFFVCDMVNQVLGTGDDGSSPCLLVSVERIPRYKTGEPGENTVLQRYIFNVGEGTQVGR